MVLVVLAATKVEHRRRYDAVEIRSPCISSLRQEFCVNHCRGFGDVPYRQGLPLLELLLACAPSQVDAVYGPRPGVVV
jgi:hypothetical protein